MSGGLQLVLPTDSRPPVQTNRSAYGKPALSPSPALPLQCPGARSSARAAGRGRHRCPGAALLAPAGPRHGGAATRGGHNFSACGSGRGRPAGKLPRRLAEIFFFFYGSFFCSPRAVRELSTSSCSARSHHLFQRTESRSGQQAGKETRALRPGWQRPPPSRCRRRGPAASPSSGGERRRRRLGVTFRAPFSPPARRGGPRVSQGAELSRD